MFFHHIFLFNNNRKHLTIKYHVSNDITVSWSVLIHQQMIYKYISHYHEAQYSSTKKNIMWKLKKIFNLDCGSASILLGGRPLVQSPGPQGKYGIVLWSDMTWIWCIGMMPHLHNHDTYVIESDGLLFWSNFELYKFSFLWDILSKSQNWLYSSLREFYIPRQCPVFE